MNYKQYLKKKKEIQKALLEFLEDKSETKDMYDNFIKIITEQKITKDQCELKLLLQLINVIGNDHLYSRNFIQKIEQILVYLKKDIQKYFTNFEIFILFEWNKRILLILIETKIIVIDEHMALQLTHEKYNKYQYAEYFTPEIKPFITDEFIKRCKYKNKNLDKEDFIEQITKEIPADFKEKRREGVNDDYLCKLIRTNDTVIFDFFVKQLNLSLENDIKESIFETNQFLMKKIKLIEYAAFFGSINIIKYMHNNGVELPQSIWIFAVHSNNLDLIKYIVDEHISPSYNAYTSILKESIKCHHNEIANYIIDNFIDKKYIDKKYQYAFEYSNYYFFPDNTKYKFFFFYLCEFGYYKLVKLFLQQENNNIDINDEYI